MTNEQLIWNYFKSHGLNDFGTAGLMGNLYAESGLNPKNLQQTYERKLGYSDDSYTDAVDHGIYMNFVKDSAGYGIAQWTFWSRKQALLSFAKSREKSIGDLNMQLDFLMKELREGYIGVLNTLCNATSVLEASNEVLFRFERPANQDESVQAKRCAFGQRYYDLFANRQNEYSFDFAELFAELRKALQNNKCSEYSLAARNWAISNGLIVGNGTLENGEPNYMWQDFITREQMVTVLHRFVQM
jgi:hypothetical protein